MDANEHPSSKSPRNLDKSLVGRIRICAPDSSEDLREACTHLENEMDLNKCPTHMKSIDRLTV